ncbi:MAG: hypothetical protein K2K53_06020 [Oscillospiraceae bacterium]|nr:hypothetical protein [Oscillospiraceae bacterium]
MSTLYFPSCRYKALSPENSQKLQSYLKKRFGMETIGCCSVDGGKPTGEDTAVFNCPTCAVTIEEAAPAAKRVSVYEYLAADESFPWPDYKGEKMTIQDCWRTAEERKMQEAIRVMLRKMNIDVVELENNYEKSDFCGVSLYWSNKNRSVKLAQRLATDSRFSPLSEEEQQEKMKDHAAKNYKTPKVICYCKACMNGVQMGGHEPIHVLDLVAAGL